LVAVVISAALIGLGTGFVVAHGNGTTTRTVSTSGSSTAATIDPALVDVTSTLSYQNATAAGTGIVLTSSGEILTNNHVVQGATSISVTDIGNGRTYQATVVGYDATADLAVLQLNGASGLKTAAIGNSSKVSTGDAVTAIGNAGGVGGTPSVSTGTVTALNQSITASDGTGSGSEQLTGLIQTDAQLAAGDSGGPLVNSSGRVIGIDTAGSSSFRMNSGTSAGFAIPINTAVSLASQIKAGQGSATVHIGPTAFLGVEVQSSSFGSTSLVVAGVVPGSPAAATGIGAGDVITSVGGQSVSSNTALTNVLEGHHPGDKVSVGWTDSSGQQHTATMQLATGPTG
jgi:S1-C subfamily serine protease